MTSPLVSIVIPCYNRENTIKNTIFSALMDPYPNFEIVVVDGGSTDGSVSLVMSLSKMDRRIRLVKQPNKGVSAARNHGAKVAKGNYLGFLDADDIYFKNSLSERMNVLLNDSSPNTMGVFCPALLIDENRKPLSKTPMFGDDLPGDRINFLSTLNSAFVPSCAVILRSYFDKVGGFDEELICGNEDYDLWHRMLRLGGHFKKTNACLVGWMQHAEINVDKKRISNYRECIEVAKRIFSSNPNSSPEFSGGFGTGLLNRFVTNQAFTTSVGIAATGDVDSAMAVASDINKNMIDTFPPNVLLESLRKQSLRAFCSNENLWPVVWQKIKPSILDFVDRLQQSLGTDKGTLADLKYLLVNQELAIGFKVICIGEWESAGHYSSLINNLYPLLPLIQQIVLPIPSDEYFGRVTVPLSLLFNISIDSETALKEKEVCRRMSMFSNRNEDLWHLYLDVSNSLIRFGNTNTEAYQNYINACTNRLDTIDFDSFQ